MDQAGAGTLRVAVLLSIQRALWQNVTPDLRGVSMSFGGDAARAWTRVRFLFVGSVGDLQTECVSLAETYYLADFGTDMSTEFEAIEHASLDLLPGEEWVFLRWEPSSN